MKKKLMMVLLVGVVVVVLSSCKKKEVVESNAVVTETPMIEEDKEVNADLTWLEENVTNPHDYFKAGEIEDETFMNYENVACRFIRVYDTWSQEEFDAYKKTMAAVGFTNIQYEYENHFAAVSEDGNWYFSIGEDVDQGRAVLIINVSKETEEDKERR